MAEAAKKHTTPKKTGPAPDPILDLIAHAYKRLDEFYLACEVTRKLRAKVGDHNCRSAQVFGLWRWLASTCRCTARIAQFYSSFSYREQRRAREYGGRGPAWPTGGR